MSRYLITGAAGFIGSSLARSLLERGEQVRGIDNFATGKPANLDEIRQRIDFREVDLLDTAAVASACAGADYVLHQGAIPSVPRSVSDPIGTSRVNIDGTLNLLVAARDAKVKRVVFAASSSAYGDTPTLPKREDMPPHPLSPYAVAKVTGEMLMTVFYRLYQLETVSLRYFNVYGPRQDPTSHYSGVLARFTLLMLRGERPTVYGDGEQSRDFTFIDNVVSANLLACSAPAREVAGRVFNIANGKRVTVNETFRALQQLTGFRGEPIYEAERAGDVRHSLADISLARRHLGYQPLVDFVEGLRRTVEWYRAQPEPAVAG